MEQPPLGNHFLWHGCHGSFGGWLDGCWCCGFRGLLGFLGGGSLGFLGGSIFSRSFSSEHHFLWVVRLRVIVVPAGRSESVGVILVGIVVDGYHWPLLLGSKHVETLVLRCVALHVDLLLLHLHSLLVSLPM